MSATADEPTTKGKDRWVYWTIIGVILVLCVIGLLTYSVNNYTAAAQQKAVELQGKYKAAGLHVPATTDMIVRSLGTDGGAVCQNPANALGKALLYQQLTNGASFVGQRPILADRHAVAGELLIMQTYCPEKAAELQQVIADLKLDDVVKT